MTESIHEDSAQPAQPSLGARLTGWKDIAAYLDRGVRTAQRWEREFGLPVRRIGREGAESVFAFTTEIDRWLESSSAAKAKGQNSSDADREDGTGNGHQPERGTSAPPAAQPIHRHERRALWLLALAVVALGTFAVWREWTVHRGSAAGPPADWRVEADTLVVIDADGRAVWTRTFDFAIDESYYAAQPKGAMGGVVDLDKDGKREVLFVATPADGVWDHARLYLFNEDRTLRWEYQYHGIVTFGTTALGGPWVIQGLFLTEDPDSPEQQVLWVASRDPAEFPSLLQRLDINTGQPTGAYWSPGWITAVALWRSPAGPRLLVGGVSNDQEGPSLASLNPARLHARAPVERDKYRCVTCPPVDPEAFIVFPKPPRFKASMGSGMVHRFDTGSATAQVTVVVSYAVSPPNFRAGAVIRLDADLRPLSVDYADGYASVYDQLVRAGTIAPTSPVPGDAASELLPLKRWQNGKFVAVGKQGSGQK